MAGEADRRSEAERRKALRLGLPCVDSLFERVRLGLRVRSALRGVEAALVAGLVYGSVGIVLDRAFLPLGWVASRDAIAETVHRVGHETGLGQQVVGQLGRRHDSEVHLAQERRKGVERARMEDDLEPVTAVSHVARLRGEGVGQELTECGLVLLDPCPA